MLAHDGYNPAFGARPLKRLIQKRILDSLAIELIEGKIKDGDNVKISWKDNKTIFT